MKINFNYNGGNYDYDFIFQSLWAASLYCRNLIEMGADSACVYSLETGEVLYETK